MRLAGLHFLAALAIVPNGPLQGQDLSSAPVQYIDHIMIRSDDPGELFALFSQTLELPIAWPIADRSGVVSGGVGFGNVNVEAIKFPRQISDPTPTQLVGLALKAYSLSESLRELERRGVAFGALRPFVSVDANGVSTTSFTNVTVQQLSDADQPGAATIQVFLSEYNPAYVDAVARRARLRDELIARGGGPLGLVRVEEVTVGTVDLSAAARIWGMLVAPARPSDEHVWRMGDGPAVRLVSAERDVVQGLVLAVVALPAARDFLEKEGLLGVSSETELEIAPSKVRGLHIRVVRDRSAPSRQ